MAGTGLRGAARRLVELMREELGRPAINRRILHRLATTDEAGLTRLGLTRRDVCDAAGPGIADAASFLTARRIARLGAAEPCSLRRTERIPCE